MKQLGHIIDCFSELLGKLAGILLVLLLGNVFYDVVMRYFFNDVSIGMQELEWHLYSSVFLLGISYALRHNSHVRVDLFYEHQSRRTKAWIDLLGTLIFLLPFAGLVFYYGIGFAKESFLLSEQSGDPGGLAYRWVIKSIIPVAFLSIFISGLGIVVRSINAIFLSSEQAKLSK